jgi:hypothetical protein
VFDGLNVPLYRIKVIKNKKNRTKKAREERRREVSGRGEAERSAALLDLQAKKKT